jgi:hypothetical protein
MPQPAVSRRNFLSRLRPRTLRQGIGKIADSRLRAGMTGQVGWDSVYEGFDTLPFYINILVTCVNKSDTVRLDLRRFDSRCK